MPGQKKAFGGIFVHGNPGVIEALVLIGRWFQSKGFFIPLAKQVMGVVQKVRLGNPCLILCLVVTSSLQARRSNRQFWRIARSCLRVLAGFEQPGACGQAHRPGNASMTALIDKPRMVLVGLTGSAKVQRLASAASFNAPGNRRRPRERNLKAFCSSQLRYKSSPAPGCP